VFFHNPYRFPKPGYLFVHAVSQLDLPAQLQVIQATRDRLQVKVVKGRSEKLDLTELKGRFQEIVGPNITVAFEFTDSIPRDPSGKFRYVVSELKRDKSTNDDGGRGR